MHRKIQHNPYYQKTFLCMTTCINAHWILYLLPEMGSVCGVAVFLALMYKKMQVYSSCYLAKYTYFNITDHTTVLTESNSFWKLFNLVFYGCFLIDIMCIFIVGDKVVQPVWTLLVCAVLYWLPTYDYCWCSRKMVLYKVYAVTIRTL